MGDNLTEKLEVWKCDICGNIVEVLHAGVGQLVCCGQDMNLMEAKTKDAGNEKHVPVVEIQKGGTIIRVGEIPHPMEDKHHIEWVELMVDDRVHRQFLTPGEKPEAVFDIDVSGKTFVVREFCNIHGLWETHKK